MNTRIVRYPALAVGVTSPGGHDTDRAAGTVRTCDKTAPQPRHEQNLPVLVFDTTYSIIMLVGTTVGSMSTHYHLHA